MPEGHGRACTAVLEREHRSRRALRQARADCGARQLAARARQAPRCHRRRRDRRPQHPDGHSARLRARRRAAAAQALLPRRPGRDRAAPRRRIRPRQGEGLTRAVAFVLAVAAIAATAAPTPRELDDLRARIAALSRELDDKEAARREARDALRDSERGISEANRALAAAAAEDRGLRAQSARLAARPEAPER